MVLHVLLDVSQLIFALLLLLLDVSHSFVFNNILQVSSLGMYQAISNCQRLVELSSQPQVFPY
jgi:hypothetical protein